MSCHLPPRLMPADQREMNAGNVPVNHAGHPAQDPPRRGEKKLCPESERDSDCIKYALPSA